MRARTTFIPASVGKALAWSATALALSLGTSVHADESTLAGAPHKGREAAQARLQEIRYATAFFGLPWYEAMTYVGAEHAHNLIVRMFLERHRSAR